MGPLFTAEYGHNLQRAVTTFLTPSQTVEVVQQMTNSLMGSWTAFTSGPTLKEAKKKKGEKKRDGPLPAKAEMLEGRDPAVSFALLCRLYSIVLPSIPLGSASAEAVQQIARSVFSLSSSLMGQTALTQLVDQVRSYPSQTSTQLALASILRLGYCIQRSLAGSLVAEDSKQQEEAPSEFPLLDSTYLPTLLDLDRLLPELRVEAVRP